MTCSSLCEQNELMADIAYQYRPMTEKQLQMFNNDKYKFVYLFYCSFIINKLLMTWLWFGRKLLVRLLTIIYSLLLLRILDYAYFAFCHSSFK